MMPSTPPPGPAPTAMLAIAREELAAALAVVGDPLAETPSSLIHFERAWGHLASAAGEDKTGTELVAWVRDNSVPGLADGARERAADLLSRIINRAADNDHTELAKDWPARELRAHGGSLARALAAMAADLDGWSPRRQRRLHWLKVGLVAIPLLALLVGYLSLWWEASKPGMWRGAYYPRDDFDGQPYVRRDKTISFNWRNHSPMAPLPEDYFSIRWDTCLHIESPVKAAFQLISNNDSRLLVDGDLAVDNWGNDGQRTSGGWYDLSAGTHHLRVDFREGRKQANIWFLATFGDDPPTHIPRSMLTYPGDVVDEETPCH